MQTIASVRKHRGVAGQFSVTADATCEGETRSVEFIGSEYGGPVVMRTGAAEVFVSDPGRFGPFGVDWVRRFFGES